MVNITKTNFRIIVLRLLPWFILITIFILLIYPILASVFGSRFVSWFFVAPVIYIAHFIMLPIMFPLYPSLGVGFTMYYIIFGLLFVGMIGVMFKIEKATSFVRKCMLPFWLLLASYYTTSISSLYHIDKLGRPRRLGEGFLNDIAMVEWRGFPFQFFSYDCGMTDPCVHIEYIIANIILYFVVFWVIVQVYRHINRYKNIS